MSCPTCDHTMQGLADDWFWCPRCGTLQQKDDPNYDQPYLVERVRRLLADNVADVRAPWRGLGEAALKPEERPT